MSQLIGGSDAWSTWARVRRAVRQSALPAGGFHNVEYYVGGSFFKTTEGNGLLRGDVSPPLMGFDGASTFSAIGFVKPYDTKFVGETVTLSGPDTFTITAAAFTPPTYQTIATTGYNPITAIGLLSPVT